MGFSFRVEGLGGFLLGGMQLSNLKAQTLHRVHPRHYSPSGCGRAVPEGSKGQAKESKDDFRKCRFTRKTENVLNHRTRNLVLAESSAGSTSCSSTGSSCSSRRRGGGGVVVRSSCVCFGNSDHDSR